MVPSLFICLECFLSVMAVMGYKDVIKDDFGGKLPSGRPRASSFIPRTRFYPRTGFYRPRGREKNLKKLNFFFIFFSGSCCRLGKREFFFNFQF
jgi:hypothetical protein